VVLRARKLIQITIRRAEQGPTVYDGKLSTLMAQILTHDSRASALTIVDYSPPLHFPTDHIQRDKRI
jgi:hypothetical protein